ncbi:Envelope fusion protein [Aphis craccivora]|uniref:Envelope fusion protein n=1 Tax=Aphis craccivora TaxID=307492 RepID=A0A6G0Y4S2_APHCR|nr:Envelope fusion protein [Aphis craccivora]
MYESIGRYLSSTTSIGEFTTRGSIRLKMGLVNIIGTGMKTLFGVSDEEFSEENIQLKSKTLTNTTVVKTSITGVKSVCTELNKLYTELRNKQKGLELNIKALVNHTYTLETLILSNRIFSIFTALMTQYSYETQTLSAIITTDRTGVLHPSLETPRELAAQLVDLKLNLPLNLNLPMGASPSEIHEFTKITKIAIFYSGSQIMFLIKIPLVTELELTLFKIIPIPHPVDIDRTNDIEYLQFVRNFNLYNTNQLHQNCESGIVVIYKDIFHKLKYANTWIYLHKKIRNQGLIKLNQECRAYAEHVILHPTREIKTKYCINFIPNIGAGSISFKINSSIKEIKMEKFKRKFDPRKLDNVHEMAHSLDVVEHMIDDEILRKSGVEIKTSSHSYLILEQLATAISFNIETQFHTNPVQGKWHNYTACFDFHIITANERILVPYEDESILEMINAAKRFLSDMMIDKEFGEPYCYELNYYLDLVQNPWDILNY